MRVLEEIPVAYVMIRFLKLMIPMTKHHFNILPAWRAGLTSLLSKTHSTKVQSILAKPQYSLRGMQQQGSKVHGMGRHITQNCWWLQTCQLLHKQGDEDLNNTLTIMSWGLHSTIGLRGREWGCCKLDYLVHTLGEEFKGVGVHAVIMGSSSAHHTHTTPTPAYSFI